MKNLNVFCAILLFAFYPQRGHAETLVESFKESLELDSAGNPVAKVVELLTGLQAKVISTGEAEQKTYNEFVDWCQKTSTDKKYEIKSTKGTIEELEAKIEQASSLSEEITMRVQELSGSIATDEADLKAATLLRAHERKDFEDLDRELTDTVDTLARARSVLEKELEKHAGASFLQKPTKVLSNFVDTLTAVVEAATMMDPSDKAKLTAFIQAEDAADDSEEDEDGDEDSSASSGPPAAAAYNSNSGSIVTVLEDMQEKAEAQQVEERKKESQAQHNFDMLKAQLSEQIKTETGELDDKKKQLARLNEAKASNSGELDMNKKDYKEAVEYLEQLQHDCMDRATEFEAALKSRSAELEALAGAKKVMQAMTGGAASKTYSFVQVSAKAEEGVQSREVKKGFNALKKLKDLAAQVKVGALTQLVSRLGSAIRYAARAKGRGAADPFGKVITMIKDMITKLESEAQAESQQKEFCDREMSHTLASKEEKEGQVEELTTNMEKAAAKASKLKQETSTLSRELFTLKASQGEIDKVRQEEHSQFVEDESDLKQGLDGVQMALKILREYYAKGSGEFLQLGDSMKDADHQPSTGAGTSIIGLLEVIESDFSKSLSETRMEEEAAQDQYEKMTQENEVARATKERDLKHKTQEAVALEKTASELEGDRGDVQMELDAVLEYYEKLKPQCIAQPEPYAERKARREKEMAGLKEAMSILNAQSENGGD